MRQIELFNDGWKFFKADQNGAEAAGFDDGGWRDVTLPHDWSIEGPFDAALGERDRVPARRRRVVPQDVLCCRSAPGAKSLSAL